MQKKKKHKILGQGYEKTHRDISMITALTCQNLIAEWNSYIVRGLKIGLGARGTEWRDAEG